MKDKWPVIQYRLYISDEFSYLVFIETGDNASPNPFSLNVWTSRMKVASPVQLSYYPWHLPINSEPHIQNLPQNEQQRPNGSVNKFGYKFDHQLLINYYFQITIFLPL